MTNFPIELKIPVAWGDMDAFGHVNNVQYMRYFETARVKYFDNMMIGDDAKSPVKPVLASLTANFKAPVVYPDTLTVKIGVTKIGNSSLNMCSEMYNQKGQLVLEAFCTIVSFDFELQRPVAVPEKIKNYIEALEGRDLSAK
jgi:acyl-CoA thioester hydrolase